MPDTLLCRFQNAKAFQVFVDALRSFVGEKVDYLLVESTPEGNVVGFACDGPRFAKQVYDPDENAVTIYRPFSVYLRPVSITNVDNVSVTLFEIPSSDTETPLPSVNGQRLPPTFTRFIRRRVESLYATSISTGTFSKRRCVPLTTTQRISASISASADVGTNRCFR